MASAAAMASSVAAFQLIFVLLAAPLPSIVSLAAALEDDGTTHLHLFMHDIVSGSSPTAVSVIKGPAPAAGSSSSIPGLAFGDTMVIDDALTETSSPTSAALGRAQGFYMVSAQSGIVLMVCANLLLTTGAYNGSTLAVVGRDDVMADVRELSVVGGTGKFRMATGYVLWKTASANGPDAIVELDLYVKTAAAKDSGTAAVDGTTGGSVVGATTGASAAATNNNKPVGAAGWVGALAVAVVVAVVGSGVW